MPEDNRVKVETYKIDYICDSCGHGCMVHTGVILVCSPPKYPHECNRCGYKDTFRKEYPLIAYEEFSQ